jgi:exosome complex component CSL4
MSEGIIVPGEKLGTEEEFAAGENTYVNGGVMYSTVTGVKTLKDGVLSVRSVGREVRTVGKGMRVLGSVVGDMKSVIFVKIDNINTENKEFVAIKDGKIVMPKQHDGGRFQRRGGPYEGRHEHMRSEPKPMRPCGIGDIIIATVQYNDKDSYALSLEGNEEGVVYAKCEQCNGEMDLEGGMLRCRVCGHTEARKISVLYNKPDAIKKLFEGIQ